MSTRQIARIRPSEITPEAAYRQRRHFLRRAAALAMTAFIPKVDADCGAEKESRLPSGDKLNTYSEITNYNNFYEYSPDKRAVATLAQNLKPHPWSLRIEGEVERPRVVDVDELLREHHPEERIYRLRCVE